MTFLLGLTIGFVAGIVVTCFVLWSSDSAGATHI